MCSFTSSNLNVERRRKASVPPSHEGGPEDDGSLSSDDENDGKDNDEGDFKAASSLSQVVVPPSVTELKQAQLMVTEPASPPTPTAIKIPVTVTKPVSPTFISKIFPKKGTLTPTSSVDSTVVLATPPSPTPKSRMPSPAAVVKKKVGQRRSPNSASQLRRISWVL